LSVEKGRERRRVEGGWRMEKGGFCMCPNHYKEIMHRKRPFIQSCCLCHTNTRFNKSVNTPSLRVQHFWLLAASLVRGADMPLMQCPYYQYTGTHFADLGRMTG